MLSSFLKDIITGGYLKSERNWLNVFTDFLLSLASLHSGSYRPDSDEEAWGTAIENQMLCTTGFILLGSFQNTIALSSVLVPV